MNERFLTRRRVLALGGAAVAAGVSVFAFTRGSSDRRGELPAEPTRTAPRTLAADIPAALTAVDDAFETRMFAPGEPIDWTEGIFFLKLDGSTEGIRVSRTLHGLWPAEPVRGPFHPSPYSDPEFDAPLAEYEAVAGGELVRARLWFPYEDRAVLLHRASGAAFTWEDNKLMVWPVGPYLMLISTESLGLERYHGQGNGYEPLDYELVDSGLASVRTGLIAAIGSTLADGTFNLAYDWSTDTLYYFAPGTQVDHRFVRVRASATTDPEDVPLVDGMESIYARPRGATGTVATLNDRETIVVSAESFSRHWILRSGGSFEPLAPVGHELPFASLSSSGEYVATVTALPNQSSPGSSDWRCVLISDRDGEPILRVRSAEPGAWTLDGRLALRTLGSQSGLLEFDGNSARLVPLPGAYIRTEPPVPSPFEADLVAIEPAGIYKRDTLESVAAMLPDGAATYGEPWSARPEERVFAFPRYINSRHTEYGEHLLPPVVEFAPFSDDLVFTAGEAFDLRDAPMYHGEAVRSVEAGERLTLSTNAREEWRGYTTAIWQGGDLQLVWAHVDTESGIGAWAPLPQLRWAAGKPL